MFFRNGILDANLFAYCNNDPINRIDPTGHSSYKNTDTKSGSKWKIRTVISVWGKRFTFYYSTTSDGIIQFHFDDNPYWSVLWRGSAWTLAKAMYKAVKSANSKFLKERTIGGINTEL